MNKVIIEKKRELAKVIGMMYVGREKNLKKAKGIRYEIVQLMMAEKKGVISK